jgi:hypothetical protein
MTTHGGKRAGSGRKMKKLQTKRIRINPNCIWLLTIVFESRRKTTPE